MPSVHLNEMNPADARILVVEDDRTSNDLICDELKGIGYRVLPAYTRDQGIELVDSFKPHVAVVDLMLGLTDRRNGTKSGLEVIDHIDSRDDCAKTKVIIASGHASEEDIVRTTARGNGRLMGYVKKPIEINKLTPLIATALQIISLQELTENYYRSLIGSVSMGDMVGRSGPMQRLYQEVEAAAKSESSVLIIGETGVGKGLVAKTIHDLGNRKGRPFVPINAVAIAPTLFEAELFGHRKGAFTNSTGAAGKMMAANGGTLFLDEITGLDPALQQKLLSVIQDREILPVGEDRPVHIDVRIIAATNEPIACALESGRLRKDLYYRLNVMMIEVPPLRSRKDDIPLLVDRFVRKVSKGRILSVPRDCNAVLMKYSWPGNVRELENVVESAVMTASAGSVQLEAQDLVRLMKDRHKKEARQETTMPGPESCSRGSLDDEEILKAMRMFKGNKSRVARYLGLTRPGLYHRLRRMC